MLDDVEAAIGVGHHAVAAGLVMITHAFHRAVVLGDVEVDGPGAQHVGHLDQRRVELGLVLPVEAVRQQGRFGRVVAHGVEQGVGHVGLEADDAGAVGRLKRIDHRLPAVHAAPADLAFRCEPFAEILGDVAGLAPGLGDELGVACRILGPVGRARGRVDADDAIRPDAEVPKCLAQLAGLADIRHELRTVLRRAHGRAATHGGPDRRHDGADGEIVLRRLVGQRLGLVRREVDVGVGRGMEDVDAVELHAIDLRRGREADHGIEVDRRLRIRSLAHKPRPHRIVKLGKIVLARHVSSHAVDIFFVMLDSNPACCPELLY